MTANVVIQTDNLGKGYGAGRNRKKALVGLSLTVQPGEVFGYLGPNGAGKSTTIRLLLDIIRPDTGRAAMLGLDVRRDRIVLHKRIGYLPGELNLWRHLTGHEVIRYIGQVRGGVESAYVNQLAERLALDLTKRVRDYSSGNRRKLGIVLAFMSRPELIILDEPTNGLDPLMQQTFYQMVREARDEGRTVFLSSHILSEVQSICDRVGILRDGRLQAVERVDALTHTDFRWITLVMRTPIAPERIAGLPGVSDVSALNDGHRLRFRLSGAIGPLLNAVGVQDLLDVLTEQPTLEEIFLAFYGTQPEQNHAHNHNERKEAAR